MTTQASSTSFKPLAVVTGASSGIGHSLAREFARNGFDLLIAAEDAGIETARTALAEFGADVRTVQADLTTYDGVETLVGAIERDERPLDAVAVNAGIGVGGSFLETDLDAELNLIALNVTSTVHLTKRVLPRLVAKNAGRILFTSSIAALQPGPFEAVYSASKAFVRSFADSLRVELKDSAVTVTTLMPGPTETNFFERAGMHDTKVGSDTKDDPDQVARQGFRALMDGKDHIVAGSLKTKLQTAVVEAVPTSVKGEIHRSMSEPGSTAPAKA